LTRARGALPNVRSSARGNNIKVVVRLRPLSDGERQRGASPAARVHASRATPRTSARARARAQPASPNSHAPLVTR
jgi:hypothetical protein